MAFDLGTSMVDTLLARVSRIVQATPVHDIHTHLYDPAQGELLLWGIDELLVYHYLVSEASRQMEVPLERFWNASKQEQAEFVWKALFVDHSPVSEACRGVITTPTNWDRLESRWAALAITFCGCSGANAWEVNCSRCTVSMVSTNSR